MPRVHRASPAFALPALRTLASLGFLLVPLAARAASFQLTGTVRTATGVAVANADLDVIDQCSGVNLFLPNDRTAADGSFAVTVPGAGTYDLHVVPPAGNTFAAGDRQDIVVTNANVAVGQITLATARLVSGTVLLPTSGGAVNVDLKFVDVATDSRVFLTKTLTNSLGQWSVRVPPGTWEVDFRPAAGSPWADAVRPILVVGAVDVSGL